MLYVVLLFSINTFHMVDSKMLRSIIVTATILFCHSNAFLVPQAIPLSTRLAASSSWLTTTVPEMDSFVRNTDRNELHESLCLPNLSRKERQQLANGERLQKQTRDGRSGNGVVVLDVFASPEDVFETLSHFDSYHEFIPTVREVSVHSRSFDSHQAEFSLSKFRLKVNVIHTIIREKNIIKFSLDDSRPNLVLRRADGFWFVEEPSDRQQGYSRVWLCASILTSRIVPYVIVDYAASRAFPRATEWLKSYYPNPPNILEQDETDETDFLIKQ